MLKKSLIGVGVCIGFILIGTRVGTAGKNDVIQVKIETAQLNGFSNTILSSGKLVYKNQVELRSEVLGQVQEVLVKESDYVAKDQVVLRINADRLQKEVDQIAAILAKAKISVKKQKLQIKQRQRELDRQHNLYKKGLIGADAYEREVTDEQLMQLELQELETEVVRLTAQLEQANTSLAKTEIRSPFSGIVIQIDVKEGESVIAASTNIPGSTLMRIADPSELLTEIHVEETDIAKIAIGQRADVFVVAYPDRPLSGVVQSIGSIATRAKTGNGQGFEVKVALQNLEGLNLKPGISCRAEIHQELRNDILTVPVWSIQYETAKEEHAAKDSSEMPYLMIDDNGTARKRYIKLGQANDTHQEITQGLSVGDSVITGPYRPLRFLKDGQLVSQSEKPEAI